MKILDKYIIKEFASPFLYILCVCCMMFLISEFFFRLPEFLHNKMHFSLIFIYLAEHMPLWIRDSLPIVVLSSILFTFSRLSGDNEITAIKSSGINLYVTVAPILAIAFALSLFSIYLNIQLVPKSYVEARNLREYKLRNITPTSQTLFPNLVVSGIKGEKFTIGLFDYKNKTMENVTIDYTSSNYDLLKQIKAKRIVYADGKWTMHNAVEQIFDPKTKELTIESKIKVGELAISDEPSDFILSDSPPEEMTMPQLLKEIRKLKLHGLSFKDKLVEYHFRIAYSFANIIVALFAIPFSLGSSTSRKRSRIRGLVMVIVISLMYWIVVSFGRSLSLAQTLPSFLGVWLADLLFLGVGVYFFIKVHR